MTPWVIGGSGGIPTGNNNVIDLTYDMVRMNASFRVMSVDRRANKTYKYIKAAYYSKARRYWYRFIMSHMYQLKAEGNSA